MALQDIKPFSWFLIIFAAALAGFGRVVSRDPYDIGGSIAFAVGLMFVPVLIAYLVAGRKKDWDAFAKWYFWVTLIITCLALIRRR